MPGTLFDQTLAPRAKNARPLGTLSLSILLHTGALAVLFLLQFTSAIQGLVIDSPLTAYVAPVPPVPSLPPPVRTSPPSHALNPDIAPAVAPDNITTEPIIVGPPPLPGVPEGPTLGAAGDTTALLPAGRGVTIVDTPPAKPTPLRVGGSVLAPARLVYVPPGYPSIAQAAHVEGEVVLEATIDEAGVVRDVKVRTSIPLLDRAAIDAVSQWRYSPTRLNGQAVPVIMLVRVRFSLR